MWSTAILVLISITNSLFLSLTIWAALQLKHTDWWVVFLIIFIMGSAYEIAYFRRNIATIVSPHQGGLEIEVELNELSRPQTAHTRVLRNTRGLGTDLQQTRPPAAYHDVNATS